MGYQCPIAVAPILIPFKDYEQEPDKDVVTRYSDGKTNIVFVGRIVPNKKFEDVIACFAAYKEKYDPTARLFWSAIIRRQISIISIYRMLLKNAGQRT